MRQRLGDERLNFVGVAQEALLGPFGELFQQLPDIMVYEVEFLGVELQILVISELFSLY